MSDVIHFEYKKLDRLPRTCGIDKHISYNYANDTIAVKHIGCGANNPDRKVIGLDTVTCGRCKRSRPYKAYKAYVLGLIDKKMLNEIGLGVSGKLS